MIGGAGSRFRVLFVAALALLAAGSGAAEESKRLLIGARLSHLWLEDTRRSGELGYDNGNRAGNFLGSLWGLDAQQHAVPSPYVECRIASSFGAGVAYDQARAKTLDWADADQTATAGDGDVEIRGLQVYAFARLPNRTRVTPYAQLGYARYWSRFFTLPGWAPPGSGRYFEVDDTRGWFVAAGGRLSLGRHLGLDLQLRHSQTGDVSARAYFDRNHHRSGAFPMRGDALGVGASWAF